MPENFPYPPSVLRLIEELGHLPGIGKRSAERMAYHILASPREDAMNLAVSIRDVKKNIRACSRCFNVAEDALCAICANPRRDHGTICIVELPRDIIAMEKSGVYQGAYHVLQGHLSPPSGIGPEQLRIRELETRIREACDTEAPIEELIFALNPTLEGDATASYLAERFANRGIRLSRLARGLSSGTELETAAPSSLQFALEGRQEL